MRMLETDPGGRGTCREFLESSFWEENGNSVDLGGLGRAEWVGGFLEMDEGGGVGGASAVQIL